MIDHITLREGDSFWKKRAELCLLLCGGWEGGKWRLVITSVSSEVGSLGFNPDFAPLLLAHLWGRHLTSLSLSIPHL